MAAVVADDPLRLPGRAGRVEDVERIGRLDRDAVGRLGAGDRLLPVDVPARDELRLESAALEDDAALRLVSASSIAASSSGLYAIARPGSIPHEAETTTFGVASSIRVASSCAAKPPKTTEWIAPSRAHASIAITASGTIGM